MSPFLFDIIHGDYITHLDIFAPRFFNAPIAQLPVYRQVEIPACRQAGSAKECENLSSSCLYIVYAIQSEVDNRIYVGFTKDLNRRLKEHNQGKTKSTKGFRPWILIYQEKAPDRASARKREKYLKSGIGKEFLKSL